MKDESFSRLLVDMNTSKLCTKCHITQNLDNFSKDSDKRDGLSSSCRDCRKIHRLEHLDAYKARDKKYYSTHVEQQSLYAKNRHLSIKKDVVLKYGGHCECCGIDRIEFMAIDHINGGGSEMRKDASMRGARFYRRLHKNPVSSEFRVLCHNCNVSLGMYGYCPHQENI